jgi:hypothetical protein
VPLPSRIDLLIPGLFGPVPVAPGDLPATPALGRLLGRADVRGPGAGGPPATLLRCFGVELDPRRDTPSAPFCRLADLPGAQTGAYVLHADPVHLRPDRDRLLLFDANHLALGAREAGLLIDLYNRHFAEAGLRLEAGTAGRWYLHSQRRPRLRTTPLHEAHGRDIGSLLPTGPEGRLWARMLNETQMLFHQAEPNRVREREGRPGISGIWTWGGGCLADVMPQCRYARVYAEDALALGLAAASGVPAGPVPDDPQALSDSGGEGAVLVHLAALWRPVLDADRRTWVLALERLERWLDDLIGGRGLGASRLLIYPCNGQCYEIGRRGLRRFWRPPFALEMRLSGGVRA